MKPFLKWIGGKQNLVSHIIKHVPEFDTYYECFLGAGSLFFALQPKKAILTDINEELINCYLELQNNTEELINLAEKFQTEYYLTKDKKEYYYQIRKLDRSEHYLDLGKTYRSARFLFLNKTAFNGVWRVNKHNQFNVPMGKYKNPKICDREHLFNCAKALQTATIMHQDFQKTLQLPTTNDFVYADPPYVPTSSSANFVTYHKNGFNIDSQFELYNCLQQLDINNIKWMLSNSNTTWVKNTYNNYLVEVIYRKGTINSNPKNRSKVRELLIKNYEG